MMFRSFDVYFNNLKGMFVQVGEITNISIHTELELYISLER